MRFRTGLIASGIFSFIATACHSRHEIARNSESVPKVKTAAVEKYANLLQISYSETEKLKFISFTNQWYGVPYLWGGKTKAGVDCSNLVCQAFHFVYGIVLVGNAIDLEKRARPIVTGELKEGDLVFFKIESQKVSHVGIYLTNHHFLHASVKRGVMISSLEETYYKKYFFHGGRLEPNNHDEISGK